MKIENFPNVSDGAKDSKKDSKLEKGKNMLYPITSDQLESLPDGTKLTDSNGKEVIKGVDYIDDDERDGYIAYGFTEGNIPDGLEVNKNFVIEIRDINLKEVLDEGRKRGLVMD